MPADKQHWFRIREELPPRRAALLTAASFLLPIAIWCIVSYTPFIWHPDVKLQLSAMREGVSTTYTAGDHVSRDFFPTFVEGVRSDNAAIRESLADPEFKGNSAMRRENQRRLRQLAPVAISNGWLSAGDAENDAAIYEIWKGIATGALVSTRPALTDENLAIVRENWTALAAGSETFDFKALPDKPLLKLVPQGRLANPNYLPAPHEVVLKGWTLFTQPLSSGQWLYQRLMHSITIVFSGFLLAAAIGVPLGVLCGTYDAFSKLFEPFIDFFRYMPAPTFSMLLVAVFLAHDAPKIALVFIGTFFQLVLVVAKTTRQLDRSLLEAAQTLGAKPPQLLGKVVVPGILPDLYNDLRILLGWAWTWLVIAELIGVKSGLTEFIETQGRYRNFDAVFPVIILIGVIGFCTDQFLAWFRGILFPYTARNRRPLGLGLPFKGLFQRSPVIPAATPESSR